MRNKIFAIGLSIVFLFVIFSGCNEDEEDACSITAAKSINVGVKVVAGLPWVVNNSAKVTFNAHSIKCGIGGADFSWETVDLAKDARIQIFDTINYELDNTLDSVWVECTVLYDDGTSFTSHKFIDYATLKMYDGTTYGAVLYLGGKAFYPTIKVESVLTVRVFRNSNGTPFENIPIEVYVTPSYGTGSYMGITDSQGVYKTPAITTELEYQALDAVLKFRVIAKNSPFSEESEVSLSYQFARENRNGTSYNWNPEISFNLFD